jgi:uncharacterized protein YjiS (DUF1127 family)
MRISNLEANVRNPAWRASAPRRPGALVRLVATLLRWRERARERRQLLAMTTRELRDIGLSNVDAWREANKPLWRD